jgi:hypothetical protein
LFQALFTETFAILPASCFIVYLTCSLDVADITALSDHGSAKIRHMEPEFVWMTNPIVKTSIN